ncbi:MAG: FAD-dependent oxidoreductase, partial [Pseudomonadota bacterium]
MRVAVIGAGWAGLAAAVHATTAGHQVTLFEAARTLGGRARALPATLPNGQPVLLDNGQHILIGAYSATLALMRQVGVQPEQVLQRMPLRLLFPDGSGLRLPDWPAPLDALAGILGARGWGWGDKLGLLRVTAAWRRAGFVCGPEISVAQLGEKLSARVRATLLEPLCVSALNTPADQASGQVFLRVIQDSLFAGKGGSNFLLPTTDLGRVLPDAAAAWLLQRSATLAPGQRVEKLERSGKGWWVDGAAFDQVLLACPPWEAARLVAPTAPAWATQAQALQHEAITTVYAHAAGARLSQPLLALHSSPSAPAQFVFDRGPLGAPEGLLAFVISASQGERETLQQQVLAQAKNQLGLAQIVAVQTVVEKRATFACT